uniref:Uncharacterized protein n=1 Tax=Panagrolaimus sp. PS1159 TaxID=55785 RepID=A0AC35GNQ3_9BILA
MILDGSLLEAKKGEAFVREKERQINEEFMELTTKNCGNGKINPGPFIKRTLIIGRELFSLLLRDVAIEETARKAFEARVSRIQIETAKKAVERNKLQERVLILQTDCEVDLEQQRIIYDEINILQKRSESLDAQISMLTEWRKSLENQILAVRAAIKQRQKHVSDLSCSFSSPPESPLPPSSFKQAERNVDFEKVWHQTDDFLPAVEKEEALDEEKISYPSDSFSSPPQDSPPTTFHRTCKKINKNYSGFLEKVWNQKGNSSPSVQEEEDSFDEEETKIEFPRSSLMVREDINDFVSQKQSGSQLISVNSSKDYKTDSTLSTTSSVSASNLSLTTSSRDISSQYDSSSDSSNVSLCSTQSSASSQESLSSPRFEKIMDKIADLDKLVLSPSFSPIPSKHEPQKHAEKSGNDFSIHQKLSNQSPAAIKTRSTKELPVETKLPSKTEEYKIVEAVKEGEEKEEEDPNEYQMEVNAIYIFLFAVFALLIYRFIRIENV